ncbi:MAG: Crp/Fnr family transcriptional regulator [Vulcanimicrobiaceae bacterium]
MDTRNRLLAALPAEDFDALANVSEPVDLEQHTRLIENDAAIRDVYFPHGGLCSHVITMATGETSEIGLVGIDGLVPVAGMFADARAVGDVVVQAPGPALRLDASTFRELCRTRSSLRHVVDAYANAYIGLAGMNAACNARHRVEHRLARWLLLSNDRSGQTTFPYTHEYLAFMLGVRRATVTEIAQRLRDDGGIDYNKGWVEILDRARLEQIVCACYGTMRDLTDALYVTAKVVAVT